MCMGSCRSGRVSNRSDCSCHAVFRPLCQEPCSDVERAHDDAGRHVNPRQSPVGIRVVQQFEPIETRR